LIIDSDHRLAGQAHQSRRVDIGVEARQDLPEVRAVFQRREIDVIAARRVGVDLLDRVDGTAVGAQRDRRPRTVEVFGDEVRRPRSGERRASLGVVTEQLGIEPHVETAAIVHPHTVAKAPGSDHGNVRAGSASGSTLAPAWTHATSSASNQHTTDFGGSCR
jgi:hypothetical protein